MAIFYRAIWTDAGPGIVDRARDSFCSWVRKKSEGALAGVDTDEVSADGALAFRLREAPSDHADASVAWSLRASLVEVHSNGSRWTTTLRSWSGRQVDAERPGAEGWVWVDVEAVSHDSLDDVILGAPGFVRELLEQGNRPRRRDVPLTVVPRRYEGVEGAEALAAMLTDVDRDLPIIVFTPPPAWFDSRGLPAVRSVGEMQQQAIDQAARMTAGLALVCQVDAEAGVALTKAISEPYAVRDGAFRIYLPGVDPALAEEWRHRYTILPRYVKNQSIAGRLINRSIALRAGARRAPSSYEAAARLLESLQSAEPAELTELLEIADEENMQLRDRAASMDQQYLDLVEEQQRLEEENNTLREALHVARKKLNLVEPRLWTEAQASMLQIQAEALPTDASVPSEAAALAQRHLGDYLALPDQACIDLADIDTCVEARAWGSSSWRAFRALHAYAKAMANDPAVGSFWVWCEKSRHPLAWPATPKKLAMAESETVNRNERLWKKRIFPVDERISATGEIFIEAHIKIAEGGGSLAPRIYFLASRITGQVHVGYFGPHRNVPNTWA